MTRVLVIDDDAGTLLGYKGILRSAGHDVATAALGDDGLFAAQRDEFDVVLCDQRLPDRPGTDVVRQIHEMCPRTAIVLVTAWSTPELIIDAKRAGAITYAAKPLVGDELVAVVDEALRLTTVAVKVRDPAGYSSRRWAGFIARGVYLPDDPKTVLLWCHGIAIAQGTLKKRCAEVHVTPKNSLDLLRLLRVVIHHAGTPWDLQQRLDVVDDRTARALIARAGFSDYSRVPSLERFLLHQRLIDRPELVDALRSRLLRVLPL